MTATDSRQITNLLQRALKGDSHAEAELLQALYDQLHQLASRHMRNERPGHTLQPTALLNEAYVRLLRGADAEWRGRAHFLAGASGVMRRVLVDHARRRDAGKRGSGAPMMELREADGVQHGHDVETVLAVDQALTQLSISNARQAQIVELRFFAGLTEEEIAKILDISSRTVKREWIAAKAWLYARLGR
jgi:RNA polymerase sigma-70 factor, ECF subfamily